MTTSALETVSTYADGYGVWHARTAKYPGHVYDAMSAIYREITEREQKTYETYEQALDRVMEATTIREVSTADEERAHFMEASRCLDDDCFNATENYASDWCEFHNPN